MFEIDPNKGSWKPSSLLFATLWVVLALIGCSSSGSTHEDAGINPPDSPRHLEGCVGLTPPDSAWPAILPPEAELVSDASDLYLLLDAEVVGATDSVQDDGHTDTQQPGDTQATTDSLSIDSGQDTTQTRTLDLVMQPPNDDGGDVLIDDSVAVPDASLPDSTQDTHDAAVDATTDVEDPSDVVLAADSSDAISSDVYDCTEYPATCLEAPSPDYVLLDFQPKSCGYGAIYGLELYKQEVSVVVLLAAW